MASPAPKDRAKQAAGQAAAAALDAVVPGAGRAASLLWKHRKKIGGVAMSFLLLIPMCSGGVSTSKQPIDAAEAVAEIEAASGLISQAKKAAVATGPLDETGVPWTVIAGIALTATAGGRYSPWDLCDRIPEAPKSTERPGRSTDECSEGPEATDEITPAIGGEGNPALGPYLLKAGMLPQGDDEIDPQRIKSTISSLESTPQTATDYVALRLASLRQELQQAGYSFSQEQPDIAAASWAEAVRRLGVLDPNNASGCISPFFPPALDPAASRANAAKVVDTTWRCILSQGTLHTFDTSSISSDPVELTPANAVSAAVEEALTVAWAYSQWGTAMPGCATDARGIPYVTATPESPAGFFPLTEAVFIAYSTAPDANRCDKTANVEAAARAFAAGETAIPGKKLDDGAIGDRTDKAGKWNKVLGGWVAMPWALGKDFAKIPSLGPLSVETARFEPSNECVTDTATWVDNAGKALTTTYNPDDNQPLQEPDAALVAAFLVSNPLPVTCVAGENAAQLLNQFVSAQASTAGRALWDAVTPRPELDAAATTTSTLVAPAPVPLSADQQRASAMLAVAQWFATRQAGVTSPTPPAPVPGYNSLVPRLSLTGASLPPCTAEVTATCLPELPVPTLDSYSKRVVEVARAAGGVVEGEDITARDLLALLAPPVFGSLANTSCLPKAVGAAIDTALKKYQQVMLQSTESQKKRERRAKSVIPVELVLEQYATESSFGVGYVDDLGWTGTRMAPVGGVADTGIERGPYKSPSRTKGVIGPRIGDTGYADTDQGRIDGLVDEDRAVGVLQFIPQSWMGISGIFQGCCSTPTATGLQTRTTLTTKPSPWCCTTHATQKAVTSPLIKSLASRRSLSTAASPSAPLGSPATCSAVRQRSVRCWRVFRPKEL